MSGDVLSNGPALLFCPADRPDRFSKALDRSDAVILDLEDAVLPAGKHEARLRMSSAELDPNRVIVRVNAADTGYFRDDLAAVRRSPFRTVMLAKTESAAQLDEIGDGLSIIALCETARGVIAADAIAAHPNVVALMWGAEDLIASLGGSSSRRADGGYRDVARHARSRVLLAAGAYERRAIDAVHVDIPDLPGLEAECRDAAASGFSATACIHPSQVEVVRRAYRPADADIDAARRVLEAADAKAGAFRFDGRMVDEPVLRQAREVLRRAGE
ncbi:HpcH/HpaI aldolase/citrate lyase family protein [Microbacterium nymphoidis]|uniref:HpcH/HpaI aldolase/citrate lyase family protein n=1 Tax=Microbacterium nymphoidis TaxID=2898586 RepID=UPI001E51FDE9|nr:CoA ester lyase [Microbacterium nymphoidis]MCD2497334.1 CoA ester lyase [Microbacterium nymphoidis]